jgi:rhamnosyltransferase
VRCKDEMPHTRRTLEALLKQQPSLGRIVFIDSGSTDGSRECALELGCSVLDVKPGQYIPGRVINQGMAATTSAQVAFVNADAVPLHPDAVAQLIAPLRAQPKLAASFGRQVARADAERLTRWDMNRAFGDEAPVRTARGAFFSMAASAISREVWQQHAFSETLRYSEDVDWTHRCLGLGFDVRYIPGARFEHSHDYTPEGTRKRRHGEGVADTAIFALGPASLTRELIRPLIGSVLRDLKHGNLSARNLRTRWLQASGYYAGRRASTTDK